MACQIFLIILPSGKDTITTLFHQYYKKVTGIGFLLILIENILWFWVVVILLLMYPLLPDNRWKAQENRSLLSDVNQIIGAILKTIQ